MVFGYAGNFEVMRNIILQGVMLEAFTRNDWIESLTC